MKKITWFLLGWLLLTGVVLGAFAMLAAAEPPIMLIVVYSVGALVQVGLSVFCFRAAENRKKFHGISLRAVSGVALVAFGLLGLIVAFFELTLIPLAMGLVVLLILQYVFYSYSVEVKPDAVEVVQSTTEAINKKTAFIRELTVQAQNLMDKCASEEDKKCAETVYEAIRYSDPMSSDALNEIEEKIKKEFSSFAKTLTEKNTEDAETAKDNLLSLIKERNNTCKALK